MDLDLFFVLGLFTLLTTVVVVIIWQAFATWRARAALAREHEYRRLAETTARTQQDTERHLGTISTELTGLGDRVTALERMLREVQ